MDLYAVPRSKGFFECWNNLEVKPLTVRSISVEDVFFDDIQGGFQVGGFVYFGHREYPSAALEDAKKCLKEVMECST